MHEPYEARRFEREEKKGSVHYGWRSFVRALNENRTRGLPFRRRTLYPLSYKGDHRIPSNRPARLPPTWNRQLMEERQEGGLDFTANIEDKRDHVDPHWMCSMFGHNPAC